MAQLLRRIGRTVAGMIEHTVERCKFIRFIVVPNVIRRWRLWMLENVLIEHLFPLG